MSYRLNVDYALRRVISDLPEPVRNAVSYALIAACDDPIAATQVQGEDDGIVRDLVLDNVIVTVLLGHETKTVTALQITYLG